MTAFIDGPVRWSGIREETGHRTYELTFSVACSSSDGPATILQAPGLPLPGSLWIIGNDLDLWAWCKWDAKIEPRTDREPNTYFDITFTFTTRPPDLKFCRTSQFEDPLLEPMKLSGSFVKYTEEAAYDLFGRRITNSAWEQIRGPQVEFDKHRATVVIEQNVADLQLDLCTSMINTVNDAPMWGLTSRMVKLSHFTWDKKWWGTCTAYYTRRFEFDVDFQTFDRFALDEGTKVLHGHWGTVPTGVGTAVEAAWVLDNIHGTAPDPLKPGDFDRFKDRNGENCKVILDGAGKPAQAAAGVEIVQIVNSGTTVNATVNITTATAHGLSAGDKFSVTGSSISYCNGNYVVNTGSGTTINADMIVFIAGNFTATGGLLYRAGTDAGAIFIAKYPESNFFLLGIPVSL